VQNTWITPLLDLHKKMALVQADTGHLRAYFEPELRLLWSFFAETQLFFFFFSKWKVLPFFRKLPTHVCNVLRLNHSHGPHDSVTRPGGFRLFGVENPVGSTSEHGRFA
jgi:hypothetical protein